MLPVRRRLSVRKRNLLTVSSQLLQIIMQIRMDIHRDNTTGSDASGGGTVNASDVACWQH